MTGQLYQLLDSEGEPAGLMWTDAEGDRPEFLKEWEGYYNNDEDPGPDEFVDMMNQKYSQFAFERVFVLELIA